MNEKKYELELSADQSIDPAFVKYNPGGSYFPSQLATVCNSIVDIFKLRL